MTPVQRAPTEHHAQTTVRVVLVEDSRAVQESVVQFLEALPGIRVVSVAGSEGEATQWLQDHDGWDAIVLDLLLQEGSGFNVLQRLRHRTPRKQVIVFSDFATPGIARRCLDFGANRVFTKREYVGLAEYLGELAVRP
jgi:DNA-binding NarL/FixJ family response regulator